MLDAQMKSLYWSEQGSRYYSRVKNSEFSLAIITSSTFVSVVLPLVPGWVSAIVSGMAATLSIASVRLNWKKELTDIDKTKGLWEDVFKDLSQLWTEILAGNLNKSEVLKRHARISDKMARARVSEPNLKVDAKLKVGVAAAVKASRGLPSKENRHPESKERQQAMQG